jgi:hypothetical protein
VSEAVQEASFEAAMAAAMATIEQAAPEPVPAEPRDPIVQKLLDTTTLDPVEVKPAEPVASDPAKVEAPPPVSSKELERIAALDAREAKLREKEAALTSQAKSVEEAAAKNARAWETFARNPVAHIRAMRPDLSPAEAATVAEQLYVYSLGDRAPAEVRQRLEVTQHQTEVLSEVDKLRADIEALRAERARESEQSEIARYQAELRSGAAAVKDIPIVSSLLQRHPDDAAQMLFEVARRAAIDSQQRGDAEPVVLTAEEAARRLEEILVKQRDHVYGTAPTAEAPSKQVAPPSPTITNRDASVQPGRALGDPLDDKELRRAALKAAGLDHIPIWD